MRLTKKEIGDIGKPTGRYFVITKYANKTSSPYIHKLGQVEDIEEELGIDLITVIKALKSGVYYRDFLDNKIKVKRTNNLSLTNYNNNGYALANKSHYFETKHYGKTWALTREKLL